MTSAESVAAPTTGHAKGPTKLYVPKVENIFLPTLTVEELYGEDSAPTGAALLDCVLDVYGDGYLEVVPWFVTAGSSARSVDPPQASGEGGPKKIRAIIRSPLSRQLQESTVECYKNRIFNESISQVAAGVLSTISNIIHVAMYHSVTYVSILDSRLILCHMC